MLCVLQCNDYIGLFEIIDRHLGRKTSASLTVTNAHRFQSFDRHRRHRADVVHATFKSEAP